MEKSTKTTDNIYESENNNQNESSKNFNNIQEIKEVKKKINKKWILLAAIVTIFFIFALSLIIYILNIDIIKLEKNIHALGEITLDSETIILSLETEYDSLNDADKKKVDNITELQEARKKYDQLLLDKFEQSEEYKNILKHYSDNVTMYNPNIYLDRENKTLIIELTANEAITELLLYEPQTIKSMWKMISTNLNDYSIDAYEQSSKYGVDVMFEFHSNYSPNDNFLESKNGVITFNVLD